MGELITLDVNGRTYYYNGQYFFDESFIVLQGSELQTVSDAYFSGMDYQSMKEDELIAFAKELKYKGLYAKAKEVMQYGMGKFDASDRFLYRILPIFTSCCREMGCPSMAIEVAESYYPRIDSSVALCTSLAAACCDVKNYEKAKWYVRLAYAKQGGGQGYKNELSLVFLRIKKETGEEFYPDEE